MQITLPILCRRKVQPVFAVERFTTGCTIRLSLSNLLRQGDVRFASGHSMTTATGSGAMPRDFIVKTPEPNPIAEMIVPGRRALGEQWQKITIAVKDDRIQVTENVPAEAPPDNTPVYTFGMGQMSTEAMNFILEGSLKQQEYRKRRPKRQRVTDAEIERMVNEMWLAWCEQKLRWLQGKTFSAPGTFNQRENPGIQNWTGVNPR